jgi:SAM-dependent methyltransferase
MPRTKHKPATPAVHPFDQLHGTDTSGLIPGSVIVQGTSARVSELTAYYGVAPSILHGVLDIWLQRTTTQPGEAPPNIERTIFLDIGAGKGRAMLLASQFPFLRVEGVELNPDLARIASANISLWNNDAQANALSPLTLHHADATTHPLPLEPTLAFLFHPFELPILRRFLRHIESSQAAHPHPFDLVYVNAEHDSYLDHHPAFRRLWTGLVPMTPDDHLADLAAIAEQKEYGSTGDELCAIYRFQGRATGRAAGRAAGRKTK